MDNCIFCNIVQNPSQSLIVYEDNNFLSFLDIFPINEGHTLVIPKKHFEFIWDLDNTTYTEIFEIVKKVRKRLQLAFEPKTIAVAIEGLSVPHSHIHLVPVYNLNELDPKRAKKASTDELKQSWEKIQKV